MGLLPKHILDIVLDKLVSLVDYLSFSSVCKRWHSVACHLPNKNARVMITTTPQALPLLLLPSQHDNVKQLFDFTKNKVSDFKLNLPHNFTNIRVSGSSHGWLIFVEKGLTVTLFNPFSGKNICLPAVPLDYIEENHDDETDYQFWINKAVLSRDPLLYPDSFEVAIIFSDMFRLGLYQSSKNSWIYDY